MRPEFKKGVIHSILVAERNEKYVSLRAASEKGTIPSAISLWWTIWRHRWLPHRWYGYDEDSKDFGNPSEWGWSWHKKNFLVHTRESK